MRDLGGKTAFVTGGASGIGLAMGRAFAEAGMRVMLADIEAKPLELAVAAFKGNLAEVRGVECDVRDYAGVERAAQATIDAFSKVHVLCNNAGVSGARGADNISLQDWRWTIDVNLMGVVHGVKAFLPLLQSHGEGGHIVNTASMAGFLPFGFGLVRFRYRATHHPPACPAWGEGRIAPALQPTRTPLSASRKS